MVAIFPQKLSNALRQLFKKSGNHDPSNNSLQINQHNYTIQNQMETIWNDSLHHYQQIFNHLQVGIWIRESMNGHLTFASKGLGDILELPLQTMYTDHNHWKSMVMPMYRKDLLKNYKMLSKGEEIEHYFRIKVDSGEVKWIYEQAIPEMDEEGKITHLFGMVADVSAKMEMKMKLKFLKERDALTALPHQQSLDQKLDELIADHQMKHFALLYIDLDDFHWINDHFGFQIGDLVLHKLANRLIAITPNNGYLARITSNEFALIIYNYKDKDDIFQLAEETINRVNKRLNVSGYHLHMTTSIGISFYPENGDQKLTVLENAHTALNYAKKIGKNNYQIYSPSRDISPHKKYTLEKELRKAIENEAFELYYQPQVNPKSGVMEGAEALIRWNHKSLGVVPPEDFIPLAEEKHLIHDMSDWVIANVCEQLRLWKEKGYQLYPISINISPIRFLKSGLVETVKKELETHQIPAHLLVLEITECTFLKNDEHILSTLSSLKDLGVSIALDDFGTGFAGLQYLQKLDVDILKIDQVFIQNLHLNHEKDIAIVSSLLHLAKGLQIKVIAEGVQEYDQLEFLKQNDCEIIQGYIFSKPVPRDAFEKIMKTKYLRPNKRKKYIKQDVQRRDYFRFEFPGYLLAHMKIAEINQRKVNVGSTKVIVKNISLGGIKFLTSLKLPINSNLKLTFQFGIMSRSFDIEGQLVWINKENSHFNSYGVSFNITEGEKDKLAKMINKMTVLQKYGSGIPDTPIIYDNPREFLRKN